MEAREPLAIVFSFLHPESFPILESQMEWGDIVLAVMSADFCIFRMLF